MTADEGDFLELLIANQRINEWLDVIATCTKGFKLSNIPMLRTTLEAFERVVTTRDAYAEEARKAGAVPKLMPLMKLAGTTGDDVILELSSTIIAACSGQMAAGVRVRALSYQGHVITVKEGALGDGVGAKVWAVAHTLCHELIDNPQIIAGKQVLEIGAGCGPVGLLAAKLGAAEVVITDYVDQLLLNLRDALHLNFPGGGAGDGKGEGGGEGSGAGGEVVVDADWDPEEDGGSECSSFGELLGSGNLEVDGGGDSNNPSNAAWEAGSVAVRFLDWADSVEYLQKQKESEEKRKKEGSGVVSRVGSYCALDGHSSASMAPEVPLKERFDVILGTDILYEWAMAESVAAAVAHRLRPGGRCLLLCAIRDQEMWDGMVANLKGRGLRVGVTPIEPRYEDGGVAAHDGVYEGGYVLLAAEHAHEPATDWHRDDLFPSNQS